MKQRARPHTVSPLVINLFFVIGIVSAFAFRVLVVLSHLQSPWFRPVWYTGVIGYFAFFLYRYLISRKRRQAVADYGLLEKIRQGGELSQEEREVLEYLLSSLVKSRENINYLVIFVLSVLAVAADVVMTCGGWP
jgi:predicted RND superfamily exporter protein